MDEYKLTSFKKVHFKNLVEKYKNSEEKEHIVQV